MEQKHTQQYRLNRLKHTDNRRLCAANQLDSQRKGNRIVAKQEGSIVDLDMEEALAMTKSLEMDRYDVLEALTNNDGFRNR